MTANRREFLAATAAATAAAATPGIAQNTKPLAGKSVLITGTSSGFGRETALLMARQGAKVIASMRRLPRPEAASLEQIARDEKLDLHVVELDVLSDASVAKGVAAAEKIAGGGLDILVNNAGIGMAGPVELQDAAAMELMFGTNLHGFHRVTRAALPKMRAKKAGLIFTVSSQLGRVIAPNFGVYSATKFAGEAWAEQLAYELSPHNIEVTIIQPGGYPTNIWKTGNVLTQEMLAREPEERKAAYPALVANVRRGSGGGTTDPADVARAIAEIAAMPPGSRPLRRPVHPGRKPQEPINKVSAEVQLAMLGDTPFGPWVKAVLT